VTTSLILEAPGAVIQAADTARRTITGTVVTYGEYGNTSAGRKRFAPGSIRLPADTPARVLLLRGHTPADGSPAVAGGEGEQAGAAVRLDNNPERLHAEFRVTALPVGDVLLAEADPTCPIRGGLSLEVIEVTYAADDSTTVVDSLLKAVAAVPFQAYPSSRMTSVAASAHDQGDPHVTAPPITPPAAEPAATPALDYTQLAAALAPHLAGLQAAVAPAGLPSGALPAPASPGVPPSAAPAPDADDVVMQAARLQAGLARNPGSQELRAALVDITNTGMELFQNRSALGEKLWEGASYSRQFTSLMRQKSLTDWAFTGWQWVNRPKVADYAGDKTAVPSNAVSVVAVKGKATRLAGAWDIDRKFVDFSDPEFWAEFWAAGVESYLEESDNRAATALVDYAVDLTTPGDYPVLKDDDDNTVWTYSLPAGYTTGVGNLIVAQADVLRAAALATAVLEDTPRVRKGPDYIVMNTADWLSLSELTNLDLPAFLSLLKVKPEGFMRSSKVAKGTIVAGVRNAATFRELGSTPVRVEAQDIARGGVDRGLFGYTGISLDRPGGIISLPLT